jgi:hypothetical protein
MDSIKCSKNSNSAEYMKDYMKNYIKKSESVYCIICGGHYKAYKKYVHDKTKKHLFIVGKSLNIT